ncbi:MAG: hypothetical protein IAF94_07685 [Pirellulaceae bacterium]|nr:hypothetical protein [Pirellulaceae bacterium]
MASLVKQMDEKVGANKEKKMASFVVILSEDPAANEAKLKELAKKEGIKNSPLTTYADSAGPEGYKVSKDAEVTVLLWLDRKVKANHAFAPGKLNKDGIKAVLDDTAKILQ